MVASNTRHPLALSMCIGGLGAPQHTPHKLYMWEAVTDINITAWFAPDVLMPAQPIQWCQACLCPISTQDAVSSAQGPQ